MSETPTPTEDYVVINKKKPLLHGKTNKLHAYGERIALGHLSKAQRERLEAMKHVAKAGSAAANAAEAYAQQDEEA